MAASPASTNPPPAQKAPWWLLGLFVFTTLIGVAWSTLYTVGIVQGDYNSHPVENITLNAMVGLAALAITGLQATAYAGLMRRRHWGRAIATIAAAFWVFTGIGILFALLAWWVLYRRWNPGVESTFTRDHPKAPAYVVSLCAVGTALLLVWIWFLYFYLVDLLTRLNPGFDSSTWYSIVTVAFVLSIPLWLIQGLAVVGLVQRHDWGAVLAMITCVLWVLSVAGLPFGIAGLIVLWRWEHPALKPQALTVAPA